MPLRWSFRSVCCQNYKHGAPLALNRKRFQPITEFSTTLHSPARGLISRSFMLHRSLRSIPAALAAAALLGGCAGYPPTKPFYKRFGALELPQFFPQHANRSEDFWRDEGVNGAPSIVVRIGEQRAYFYRGRKLAGATRTSTGKKGFGTPPGNYRVIQKDRDHVSTLYGDYVNASGEVVKSNVDVHKDSAPPGSTFRGARMPYFLRFRGGHGLHAGHVPNFPASHGCVRLPADMARHFFENSEIGTPVRVEE
ncbi:MAG TPA: L,D-transpeptidase family protein [Chthoniobacteraceae bacterium]|nr:L,D-transpeptidase family protein [Chthoniobacteraceae bacterium]